MTNNTLCVVLAVLIGLGLALPAHAEATGGYSGLGRALAEFFLYALAYLVFFITFIVLAVKRRKAALGKLLIVGLTVAVLFPLADTLLMNYQKSRVAAAELRAPVPDLADKTILYVSPWDRCFGMPCEALIELQGRQAIWTIPPNGVMDMDFSQPIDLANLPLAQWVPDPAEDNIELVMDTSAQDRPVFDYVVVSRSIYYKNRASPIADVLPQIPAGTLLGSHLSITDMAAPIENNTLDLSVIQPDLLTLYISRKARLVPLFTENTMFGSERGYRWRDERANWFCGEGGQRTPAQGKCAQALR